MEPTRCRQPLADLRRWCRAPSPGSAFLIFALLALLSCESGLVHAGWTPPEDNVVRLVNGSLANSTLSSSRTVPTPTFGTMTRSISISLTSVTPDLTLSQSLELTDSSTLSVSLSESTSPSTSPSESLTLTEGSDSASSSLDPTPTWEPSSTAEPTESAQLTTSALPASTSEHLTASETLRVSCPVCGNGVCNKKTLLCECYFDSRLGHWAGGAEGAGCTICGTGYFGPKCLQECPGYACNACNGHGQCDDGTKGTGTCTCHASATLGHWNGTECLVCAAGWYGRNCTNHCPCAVSGAHGRCDSGRDGTGQCVCDAGWNGAACNVCNASVIPDCVACPNSCSGHGACRSKGGTFEGECVCDEYYAGADCSLHCAANCGGVGSCSDGVNGTGQCTCPPQHEAPGCDLCEPLWYGANCTIPCDCSYQGRCQRLSGACECNHGFIGTRCDIQCPRDGANRVCASHGRCVGDGVCQCSRSASEGYFGGRVCDVCAQGYSAQTCDVPCPRSVANGEICGGDSLGRCWHGAVGCDCVSGRCGPACDGEVDPQTFECSPCAEPNKYGAECDGVCPCTSHGICNAGKFGDGTCRCGHGYTGELCADVCPGGQGTPCNNNGVCHQANQSCTCHAGYGNADCAVKCPDCGSHGRCSEGAQGTGLCDCDSGWAWPDTNCTTRCDCGGHGACNKDFICICGTGWGGAGCSECAPGYSGDSCDLQCTFGTTSGRTCSCETGYGGASCDQQCPRGEHGAYCSDNGVCDDGWFRSAACLCFPGYVGPSCGCHEADCARDGKHVCEAATGNCTCTPTRTGPECDQCVRDYWGDNCDKSCACGGHGTCLRASGVCLCDSSPEQGYWTGTACDACLDGFIGAQCRYRQTTLNTLSTIQSRYGGLTNASANSYVVVATSGGDTFGEQATNVFHIRQAQGTVISTEDPGTVVAGGPTFNAAFDGRAATSNVLSTSGAAGLQGKSPFCTSAVLKTWQVGDRLFAFGARGICGDLLQLFVSEAGDLQGNPHDFSSVVRTARTRYGAADMAVVGKKAVLCFASAASEETDGRPALHCHGALPQRTPQLATRMPLRDFALATAIAIDAAREEVIVAGNYDDGRCGLLIVRIDPTLLLLSESLAESLEPRIPLPSSCRVVGCLSRSHSGVVAAGGSTGTGVSFYSLRANKPQRTVFEATFPVTDGSCTDVVFDNVGSVGLAAIKQREYAHLVKLRVDPLAPDSDTPLVPYGEQEFRATSISDLAIDERTKTAFGVADKSAGIVVFRFLLVDVESITPPYADLRAGTSVTVTGRGFHTSGAHAFCRFGAALGPAIVVNSSVAVCVAPYAELADGCGEQQVDLTLNGWAFTQNTLQVNRVNSPSLSRAVPPVLYMDATQAVTEVRLYGFNFVPTGRPTCRFTDGVTEITARGIYVDGALLICDLRGVQLAPLFANATADVSLDGTQFSEAGGLPFSIVGAPATIVPQPALVVNNSFMTTKFAASVFVNLVDARGNIVRETRAALPRSAEASYNAENFTLQTSSDFAPAQGHAELLLPDMRRPKVGDYIFDAAFGTWAASFTVRILQGDLYRLLIVKQPPSAIFANERISNSTVLQLLDISDNVWIPTEPRQISCALTDIGGVNILQRFADESASIDGDAVFDRLEIDTSLGVQLRLRFEVQQHAEIPAVVSEIIRVECLPTQFQFRDPETSLLSCRDCEPGAICDGSADVRIVSGFWMGNLSAPIIYECPISDACIGGIRSCSAEYTGPLCAVCAPGYGKNQDEVCQSCGDDWVAPLVVSATVFCMLVGVVIAVVLLAQYSYRPTNAMVIIMLFINFGQTLSAFKYLNAGWPFLLRTTYAWAAVITDYQMHSVSSDCLLREGDSTYLDKAVFYYTAMFTAVFIAIAARIWLQCVPTAFLSRTRKVVVKAQLALGNVMPEHRTLPILSVAVQTYLFVSYQATATHALTMFKCKEIVDGPTTLNVLEQDYTVSCDSSGYASASAAAAFMIALYGIAVPMGQMVYTAFIISRFRALDREHESQAFLPLLLLGLRPETWYWHSLVLVRKFTLVLVIAMNDRPLNSFLALWVLNGYLMLVWVVRPFANEAHNFLELFATFSAVLTVNTGLLNMAAPWSFLTVGVIVLVLLFVGMVLCVFAFNIYEPMQRVLLRFMYRDVIKSNMKRLMRRRDRHGNDDADDGDADSDRGATGVAALLDKIEGESVDEEAEQLQEEFLRKSRELAQAGEHAANDTMAARDRSNDDGAASPRRLTDPFAVKEPNVSVIPKLGRDDDHSGAFGIDFNLDDPDNIDSDDIERVPVRRGDGSNRFAKPGARQNPLSRR